MSRPFCRNSPAVLLAIMLIAAAPAPFSLEHDKREPIVITSNRLEADKLDDVMTFSGDVVLKKETLTLNADTVYVHYAAETKGVHDIEARGNVVVTQEGRIALAEKAIYYSNDEKIVLTGDARIIENENQVGGERITLFMRNGRSIVEGGKLLIYQDAGGKPHSRPGGTR
jgi:lipopolysaccharide export system protein LptA